MPARRLTNTTRPEMGLALLEACLVVTMVTLIAIASTSAIGRAVNSKNCAAILLVKSGGQRWVTEYLAAGIIGYRYNPDTGVEQCCNVPWGCWGQQDEFNLGRR